jgi:hypothetical protein
MPFPRCVPRGSLAIPVLLAMTACAQHNSTLPQTPFNPGLPSPGAVATPQLVPPKCKGQHTTKNYASLTETLSTQGGSLCIPAIGGFGGSIKYPGAKPSVKLTLTSSTTNYNHMPNLGSGSALFYMQLALSSGTSFGTNARTGGGLTGKEIVPGKSYTAYGQAVIYGIKFNFGPCYTVAKKGKYGGVVGGVGTLLEGEDVPVAATAVVEIYSGKQTSSKC